MEGLCDHMRPLWLPFLSYQKQNGEEQVEVSYLGEVLPSDCIEAARVSLEYLLIFSEMV